MQILLFTRNGSKTPNIPKRPGLEFKHVHFETNNLEELLLIGKYRIINFPTSLIIDKKGKVLLKVKGSIPNSYIEQLVD